MIFSIIGCCGYIAQKHIIAIQSIGGIIKNGFDTREAIELGNISNKSFKLYNDYNLYIDSLKSDPLIKTVVICSPNYLHYQQVMDCLSIDKSVICEKPLCMDVTQANQILKLSQSKSLQVRTILQMRQSNYFSEAKSLLKDKDNEIEFSFVASRKKDYFKSWKANLDYSGGALWILGPHYFDMFSFLLGKIKSIISSQININEASGIIEYESGKLNWNLAFIVEGNSDILPEDNKRFFKINGKPMSFYSSDQLLHNKEYVAFMNEENNLDISIQNIIDLKRIES